MNGNAELKFKPIRLAKITYSKHTFLKFKSGNNGKMPAYILLAFRFIYTLHSALHFCNQLALGPGPLDFTFWCIVSDQQLKSAKIELK